MTMKTRGFCFSFILIFTITTITLPPGGLCGVNSSKQDSEMVLKQDKDNVLASRGLRKMLNLDSKQRELKSPTSFSNAKYRYKVKLNEEKTTFTSSKPPDTDCTEGKIKHLFPGKFTITGQLEANSPHLGYQSDSAVSAQSQDNWGRVRGQRPSSSEESWQRLQPVVECGDEGMTLTVRKKRAVQLLLDRENKSSMPLSQLSPDCGYSVQSSWRGLSLMAKYDACQVIQEDDHYVLPLLWKGTPVKMSCPASQTEPQVTGPSSLCCSPHGLSITLNNLSDSEELRVNVRGEWTPLEVLAKQCGYTVERRDAEMVITAPFIACGVTVKNGNHTLSLQAEGKTFTLSCPVSPSEPPLPPQPLIDQKTESKEPLPWTPPFYLAPPYHPHPTYHHTHPHRDAEHTPTPSPSPPDPVLVPQAHPPLHYQTSYYSSQESPSFSEHVEDSSEKHLDQDTLPETHTAAHSPSSDEGTITTTTTRKSL
ncbi:uncharacterized protein LOC141809361 [Halichoeres trimaculatus]|uniref:uncharacterized protein LOC141809361 n=1 Tax=Halichoeres trimaculatus TaxID=147232 RepID=UPI003D9E73C0